MYKANLMNFLFFLLLFYDATSSIEENESFFFLKKWKVLMLDNVTPFSFVLAWHNISRLRGKKMFILFFYHVWRFFQVWPQQMYCKILKIIKYGKTLRILNLFFFCQHRVYSILCQNSILEINWIRYLPTLPISLYLVVFVNI